MKYLSILSLIMFAVTVQAENNWLQKYAGDYHVPAQNGSCSEADHVEVSGNRFIVTSTCDGNYNDGRTDVFLCNEAKMTCVFDPSVVLSKGSDPAIEILLLDDGNFILENPSQAHLYKFFRDNN